MRNARLFVDLAEETGDVAAWFWQFVGGRPKRNAWKTMREVPARTAESDAMSLALRKRGFTFVGSTICYSFMQATGMVNDHMTSCFRYQEIVRAGKAMRSSRARLSRAKGRRAAAAEVRPYCRSELQIRASVSAQTSLRDPIPSR